MNGCLHASPDYVVRESRRARSVRLEMSRQSGLKVIVPHGFDPSQIFEILKKKKRWIDRTRLLFQEQQAFFSSEPPEKLPIQLSLTAVNEVWKIEYEAVETIRVKIHQSGERVLTVRGNTQNVSVCRKVLCRWLMNRSCETLVPWLRKVSDEFNLPYGKASVRMQRTRWASCSRNRNISLNMKLLFLPASLVRYVFLHELCHTLHMSHSSVFWKRLMTLEPNAKNFDRQLKDTWRYIPAWIEN